MNNISTVLCIDEIFIQLINECHFTFFKDNFFLGFNQYVLFQKISFFRFDKYVLFQKITYSMFLYAPTIGITLICCSTIALVKKRAVTVSKTEKDENQRRKEKQAVVQLVLIIISFLIGYLPFTGKPIFEK